MSRRNRLNEGTPGAGEPGIRADGWLSGIRHYPSPNRDARPLAGAIDLLVIHNISLPPGEFGGDAIEALFSNRLDPCGDPFLATLASLRVSSHFLIGRDGHITQFVSCLDRAWHAGASEFEGRIACNDFSIGIELEGTDFVAFEPPQYRALASLVGALRARYALRAVRGHQHIAAGRKTDPGPHFDWRRLAIEAALPAAMLPAG
ncbi:MAG: 1,6-anhydro-N-acetylmuramyl-L-alanine amidase AmpD [Gemmatimonadota bacterium]